MSVRCAGPARLGLRRCVQRPGSARHGMSAATLAWLVTARGWPVVRKSGVGRASLPMKAWRGTARGSREFGTVCLPVPAAPGLVAIGTATVERHVWL